LEQEEHQNKTLDNKEIASLTQAIVHTKWYREIFEPFLKKEIEKNGSIKSIDQKHIELSYFKQLSRHDVYKRILNTIDEWIRKGG